METSPSSAAPLPGPAAPSPAILAEITAGLSAGDDLRELLARLLRPLVDLAGAQAGAVRVLDHADRRMHLIASTGLPTAVMEAERAVDGDCGACGLALRGTAAAWSHDLTACTRRNEGAYFGSGCRRILAVPLAHRGRTLGLYNLFYASGVEPSGDAFGLLESVGALLGLALDNVRLERENLRAALASERQVIAAEVHDSIGQSLAYVKMRLPLLEDAIRGCDQSRAEGYFDDVRDAIRQAHGSLRAVLTHMRAPMDPLGLIHAVHGAAAAFRRSSGLPLTLHEGWPAVQLTPAQEAQVFHIVQEALSNIARHAGAAQAWLHLGEQDGLLAVTVEDDGRGLPPSAMAADSTHYGLAIMRERARRLGGLLELEPRAGGGTRVALRFPAQPPGGRPMGLATHAAGDPLADSLEGVH